MALGKRKIQQSELFLPAAKLVQGPGHPFYSKLNDVLAAAQFDDFVEGLCTPYYKDGGQPSIPPGAYFRMLLIGYFEGLDIPSSGNMHIRGGGGPFCILFAISCSRP